MSDTKPAGSPTLGLAKNIIYTITFLCCTPEERVLECTILLCTLHKRCLDLKSTNPISSPLAAVTHNFFTFRGIRFIPQKTKWLTMRRVIKEITANPFLCLIKICQITVIQDCTLTWIQTEIPDCALLKLFILKAVMLLKGLFSFLKWKRSSGKGFFIDCVHYGQCVTPVFKYCSYVGSLTYV